MALTKYGGGIIQMSGSIAGDTHARNRFGNYIRARTKPVNPNSSRQQKMRAILGQLTTRWAQTLTDAQRTAWNLYGDSVNMLNRLGEVVHLTGMNHFIRSNSPILDVAGTPVDAGPTTFELPEKDGTLVMTGSEATQQFSITFDDTRPWCSEDNAYLYFLQGAPQNPQRNFFGGPYRGFRFIAGDSVAPITSPQVLGALFVITEGQRVWGQFRIIRADGRISQPFRDDCIVGA